MKIENVKLALDNQPKVADKLIEKYSVKSAQKQDVAAGVHKKGSTLALFAKAQASGDYSDAYEITAALKEATTRHAPGTLALRKANDLLINIYRWTKEKPEFAQDVKIKELRSKFFPENETPALEALLGTYKERKEVKRVLGQLALPGQARTVIHYAFELEKT